MDDFIGGNDYKQTEEQASAKKWMKIIGVILFLLLIACIALIGAVYYIQSTELKINLNGEANKKLENVLIFNEEKVYIPIRAFAEFVGYQSSNGGYKQYSEDTTKCYVESANEVASFELNSNKIYKTLLTDGNDNEYYEIDEPVILINNQLCTTIEGAKIAFNISMSYNKEQNQINIFTLPYLVTYYTARFQNAGISERDASFSNQKALLYNMIIVKNTDNHYGVYSLDGKEILGTKYSKIKFIESTQEFIVTTLENKMGIMLANSATKINPEYDDIKQIDKDSGLYLVKNNNKQGVINSNGSIIIYLEYNQIGINNTDFTSTLQNQYLLYNKCIPVKQNNKWGLFDKTGNKLTEIIYDDLGCSARNSSITGSQNANNTILLPAYEGIVVKSGNLYGLVNSSGKVLIPLEFTSIYSVTSSGTTTYYMTTESQVINLTTYMEQNVLNNNNNNNETNTNQNIEGANNNQTNNANTVETPNNVVEEPNNTQTQPTVSEPNAENNQDANVQANTTEPQPQSQQQT